MEDHVILECGHKGVKGNEDTKNAQSVSKIEKLMNRFLPGALVLPDVNAADCHRAARIKALHQQIVGLGEKHKCKVTLLSGKQLRIFLLGDAKGTKHGMAEMIAQKFPTELASKLPPKRRTWESENGRMDTFDAVALAMVFGIKQAILHKQRQKDEQTASHVHGQCSPKRPASQSISAP
jgi:hypothetical protein